MLNSIEIENYRSIKSLSIEGFSDVNIFIGENDIGKTTVLESIFLCHCKNVMPNILNLSNLREHSISSIDDIDILWNNKNVEKHISFNFQFKNKNYIKSLEFPLKKLGTPLIFAENHSLQSTLQSKKIQKIEWDVRIIQNQQPTTIVNKIKDFLHNEKVPDILAQQFSPKITHITKDLLESARDVLSYFPKRKNIIDNLQLFNQDIISLDADRKELVVNIKSDNELIRLPLQSMGSGFAFIVSLLVYISNGDYKALIIDEIENGQHIHNISKIFKFLLEYCSNNDIQLFIGTHSYDVIRIALDSQGDLDDQIDIKCFKLSKDLDNVHNCIQFSEEQLKYATSESIDIR